MQRRQRLLGSLGLDPCLFEKQMTNAAPGAFAPASRLDAALASFDVDRPTLVLGLDPWPSNPTR